MTPGQVRPAGEEVRQPAELYPADQIAVGGQQLDGNGMPGDNFTLGPAALFRLCGDARADNADFFRFRTRFGTSL